MSDVKIGPPTFLLIGGGGFVGTNLNHFIKTKNLGNVINVDNGRLSTDEFEYKNLDIIKDNSSELRNLLKASDVVINLAAITRVEESIVDPYYSYSTNVNIHHSLLEELRKLKNENIKPPICLFFSTGGAIAGETKEIITENTIPMPISPYGSSKLACESLGFSYHKTYGLDIRNLRFTNIYGPFCDKKESVIARFIKNINNKETVYIRDNGTMIRDFIYVDDVASATLKMFRDGKPGQTIQFGSGQESTIKEVIELLADLAPAFKVENTKSLSGEVSCVKCDITYAKKQLNWEPMVDLKVGMSQTWDYLKNKREI